MSDSFRKVGLALAALVAAPVVCPCGHAQDEPQIWFEDLRVPLVMTEEDAEQLTRSAAARAMRTAGPVAPLPGALQRDRLPRVVLLSLSDGDGPARVVVGTGRGIVTALDETIKQATAWPDYRPIWVKLDVVQTASAVARGSFLKELTLERSLHGLAFGRHSHIAFTPGELVSRGLVNRDQQVQLAAIMDCIRQDPIRRRHQDRIVGAREFDVFRFSCESFFCDGRDFARLYRGHRIFDDLSEQMLLDAARAAGRYLIGAVKEDGRFAYAYLAESDSEADGYNILRHAGTVYSMMELYAVTRDEDLLAAGCKAMDYLLGQVKVAPRGEGACVVEDGFVKLGANALAIVALAKHAEVTGERTNLPMMRRLARWIRDCQADDGRFDRHKVSHPGGVDQDFRSGYYPGEALLALLRLHALDRQDAYLNAAEMGARYLITVRDRFRTVETLSHDHWLLYALNDLYRKRPKRLYMDHSLRIATAIALAQNRDPEYPDWLGSYYKPPRAAPTATRTEGVLAAFELARDHGRAKEADVLLECARRGVRFQLQLQLRPTSAMYLPAPRRCMGGFRCSLTDYEIRIDYVQHNISALLALRRALAQERE